MEQLKRIAYAQKNQKLMATVSGLTKPIYACGLGFSM